MARRARVRDVRRRHCRLRIIRRLDGVDTMAVSANRRPPVPCSDLLAVDALFVLMRIVRVALRARFRNIELRYRRFRIAAHQNVMGTVAIGANCGFFRASGDGLAVNTLFIRTDRR